MHDLQPGTGVLDHDRTVGNICMPTHAVRPRLAGWNHRRVMQKFQMREVDTVFAQLLNECIDRPGATLGRDEVGIRQFRNQRHLPRRSDALGVIPGPNDSLLFARRQGTQYRLAFDDRRHDLRVRNAGAPALRAVGPMMKRAADRLAIYLAAATNMRAEMRTIGIDHSHLALFGAELHPLLTEVLHVAQFAWLEIFRIGNEKPSER